MEHSRLRTLLFMPAILACVTYAEADWLDNLADGLKDVLANGSKWVELKPNENFNTPMGARLIARRPIFNSVWFINKHVVYAVSDHWLHRSTNGGKSWEPVVELPKRAQWVQFEQSGQRGYAGSPFLLEVTDDGGKQWRTVDPAAIFTELTGKQLDEQTIDWSSAIQLSPESGEGAFSAGCHYFTTEDMGRHWSMHSVEREPGKKLCIAQSPFAVDFDNGLIVATRVGGDAVYKRQANGRWQTMCDFDKTHAILLELSYCADVIDPAITSFVSRFESFGVLPPMDYEAFDLRELNTPRASERLDGINLQDNGRRQWLSFRGQLALKLNESTDHRWQVVSNMPRLEHLYPVSRSEALGIDDYGAFLTNDAGVTWQPLGAPGSGIYEHWYQAKHNRLWATSDRELWVIDAVAEGRWKKVPTPYLVDEFATINHDSSEELLWIESNEPVLLLSRDGGITWTALEIESGDEPDYERGIDMAHCQNNPPSCLILTKDGNLITAELFDKAPRISDKANTSMPEYEYMAIEWMTVDNGDVIAYDDENARILVNEKGDSTWDERPVPHEDLFIRKVNHDGKILASSRDRLERAYLHVGKNYGKSWSDLRLKGWEGSVRFLCADDTLNNILIGEDGEGIAFSNDGGNRWQVIDTDPAFCGIANGYMWMFDRDFRIYALGE